VHPLGKSPVITDGDKTSPSRARSSNTWSRPTATAGCARRRHAGALHYTYFLHYAEGSLMPLLFMKLVFSRLPSACRSSCGRSPRDLGRRRQALLDPQIANHFMFLESELAKRDWFAGAEFTAADIQMSFPLEAAARPRAARAPDAQALGLRSTASTRGRPTSARLDKGGPYEPDEMIQETRTHGSSRSAARHLSIPASARRCSSSPIPTW
jgi:glutathione S-transferase